MCSLGYLPTIFLTMPTSESAGSRLTPLAEVRAMLRWSTSVRICVSRRKHDQRSGRPNHRIDASWQLVVTGKAHSQKGVLSLAAPLFVGSSNTTGGCQEYVHFNRENWPSIESRILLLKTGREFCLQSRQLSIIRLLDPINIKGSS
jgi:hypothetical protein